MKCIVSGAAGFIGSHLCERLVRNGHDVIGIDNMSSGSKENIEELLTDKHFRFYYGDITEEKIDLGEVDWVFHLAAKADVVPSIEDPFIYHHTNVTGTVRMLEMARRAKAKRFIYAASSSCYGTPNMYPTGESSTIKPQYPYALTKFLGEQCVLHWNNVYKLPALSLRLFNVYGPRSRTNGTYGAVFGVFMAQIANNLPVTVVGSGRQSRDFTYVSDVVDAFCKAAQSSFKGEVYNIGTGVPHSVNEIVALLGASERITLPDRPGEPRKTQARASSANRWLNWEPKVSFEDGLEIMKSLIPKYKSAPVWTKDSIDKATKTWFECLGH